MSSIRVLQATAVLILIIGMGACAPLAPYRTSAADANLDCTPAANGSVAQGCGHSVLERSRDYDLMFVEFDDQGLQYPSEQFGKPAGYQIGSAIERLRTLAQDNRGLSVVVFVHGWNHNASSDDENVVSFRRLLSEAARIERAEQSGYRVVGLYVGWRGLSTSIEPFKRLSFWTRKSAALHVAQGSSRELFSRLRGFKCAQVTGGPGHQCADPEPGTRPKVQLMMIGHSFGGLVLFNAVSGSLIESLTHAQDRGVPGGPAPRYGDMVILLNPAFEATRYTPLHRIATLREYDRYQAPLLVSVTTKADGATGQAFPLGRFFNSLFERVANEEENTANTHTIGHMDAYVTHDLSVPVEKTDACAGWTPLEPGGDDAARLKANLDIERANSEAFRLASPDFPRLHSGWTRTFCGGPVLRHRPRHTPNSVVWNVSTDETIMTGHNDISNRVLWDFLRQTYQDTVSNPRK